MSRSSLPLHPTRRHPKTGLALQAIWVRPDGRICWPIIGAAPDDEPSGGGKDEPGKDGKDDKPSGGGKDEPGGGGGDGTGNATDGRGRDLGYPANTAVEDMSDGQQAAYWRHRSQKHEGRTKALTGEKSFDETKANLEAFEKWQREQQTPSEQAISDSYKKGRADATAESSSKAATAILRANLTARGLAEKDVLDVLDVVDVKKFITDDGDIDTTRLAATAEKFSASDTDPKKKARRDYGGGSRQRIGGGKDQQSGGKAEAARRIANRSGAGFGAKRTANDD